MKEKTLERRISAALARAGIEETSPETMRRLDEFTREVALWSARIHLVGKSSTKKTLGLLVLDSLLLLKAAEGKGIMPVAGSLQEPRNSISPFRIADIGSGAGFPGIVWKIFRPALDVTLFERKERIHGFLERIIAILAMEDVRALADDAAKYSPVGSFGLVVSKAAGRLSRLLPLAERLLVPDGPYLTIKGSSWRDELDEKAPAAMQLESVVELPEGRGAALIFRKGGESGDRRFT